MKTHVCHEGSTQLVGGEEQLVRVHHVPMVHPMNEDIIRLTECPFSALGDLWAELIPNGSLLKQ